MKVAAYQAPPNSLRDVHNAVSLKSGQLAELLKPLSNRAVAAIVGFDDGLLETSGRGAVTTGSGDSRWQRNRLVRHHPSISKGNVPCGHSRDGGAEGVATAGCGTPTLEGALARSASLEKVELEVFSDNIPAVRLYESFGFREEGVRVRGRKLEDRYQDVVLMAYWLDRNVELVRREADRRSAFASVIRVHLTFRSDLD